MHYRIGLLHPDLSTLSHAEPQTKLVSVLFFFSSGSGPLV